MERNNGPRVEFGDITITKVMEGKSATSDIAVLAQPINTVYPAAQAGNDKADSLFDTADFGDGQSYASTRNAIIKVPKGTTVEQVQTKMDNLPDARIYRELSFDIEDVLTDNQKSMLAQGLSTMSLEEYKENKAVKNSETQAKVLVDGKVQYRSLYFAATAKADIDHRDSVSVAAERTVIATENSEAIATEVSTPVM
jgi:hypothetical protein